MSTLRHYARQTLVVLGIALLSGCYSYHPVASAPVGSMVRVRVPVTSALNNPNRAPETASIEGLVVAGGDTISLATETRREFGAYREIVQHDTIRLAATQASLVEVREFSSKKSVALGVVIAGGAGLAAAVAFGLGGGRGGNPTDPGTGPQTAVVVSASFLSTVWGLVTR